MARAQGFASGRDGTARRRPLSRESGNRVGAAGRLLSLLVRAGGRSYDGSHLIVVQAPQASVGACSRTQSWSSPAAASLAGLGGRLIVGPQDFVYHFSQGTFCGCRPRSPPGQRSQLVVPGFVWQIV